MDFVARLEQQTYVTEYNPNCRMRFLVRLVAPGTGYIDKLPPGETKDAQLGQNTERSRLEGFQKNGSSQEEISKKTVQGTSEGLTLGNDERRPLPGAA